MVAYGLDAIVVTLYPVPGDMRKRLSRYDG